MITKANLKALLKDMNFVKEEGNVSDIMSFNSELLGVSISVDFTNERIIYPDGIEADRDTTKNFSANENFVVLQCVWQLLGQGYKPEHIVLEPKTPGGREDSHFYCDILVRDNEKRPYMLIECKTMDGKEDDEFNKAWKKTLRDGGQLFNYYNSYRQAKYLMLYASDFVNGQVESKYHLITMTDNKNHLDLHPQLISFEQVTKDNGSRDDFYKVWKDTYLLDDSTNGVFDFGTNAFEIGKKKITLTDLNPAKSKEYIQGKYHQFAQILRQYNVSGRENAFDKLVNLFLVKIVDEVRNANDLQFQWKGAAYDDYFSFQDRLQKLYQIGMRDYLDEEVTYIEDKMVENAFRMQKNDPDAIRDTILEYFHQLKFYSNSDFGFLDVHNKQLFEQNAVILKAIVQMLQDMRLRTDEQNQFLGDLFEGFLDQGVKQNEGQFFTPTPITRFMISSLPLEQIIRENTDIPKAIDYACGAGHFLNEYAAQIKPFVEKFKGKLALTDYYKQIYGIEKEYRLSKVSKVSSFMYGQEGVQIIYGDGLLDHIDKGVEPHSFKALIANPPYSVKGFLETLSQEERDGFEMSRNIKKNAIATFDGIETFFIERAKHLLKPGGVAAIILPKGVIDGKGYYSAREMLLSYFDIIGFSVFEGKVFGKTATKTVSLFIRKKQDSPNLKEHILIRLKAFFDENDSQQKRYQDSWKIESYCNHIDVDFSLYCNIVRAKDVLADFRESEFFMKYEEAFQQTTLAKKILSARVSNKHTEQDKQSRYEGELLSFIKEKERIKLLHYILALDNPCQVVVSTMPSESAAQKTYLGYTWSERKGYEGAHVINMEDTQDEELLQDKGWAHIVTPLYDPQHLQDSTVHINGIIRTNFAIQHKDELIIPEHLKERVSLWNLEDLMDFNNVNMDNVFNYSGGKFEVQTKYTTVPLGPECDIKKGTSITSAKCNLSGKIKVVSGGLDFANYHDVSNRDAGAITISASGANAGFVNYWNEPIFAADCNTIVAHKDGKFSQKFIYYYLCWLQQQIYNLQKGSGQPHVYGYSLAKIPVPDITIQLQDYIVKRCEDLEVKYSQSKDFIKETRKKKKNDILKDFVSEFNRIFESELQ